jgi:hypothetical protein
MAATRNSRDVSAKESTPKGKFFGMFSLGESAKKSKDKVGHAPHGSLVDCQPDDGRCLVCKEIPKQVAISTCRCPDSQ